MRKSSIIPTSNNNGNGLWGDVGDTGTVFSGNTITGSRLSGIRYEISHYATYREQYADEQ